MRRAVVPAAVVLAAQARCEEIPANAQVTFSGRPLGHGTILLPTRLTWSVR